MVLLGQWEREGHLDLQDHPDLVVRQEKLDLRDQTASLAHQDLVGLLDLRETEAPRAHQGPPDLLAHEEKLEKLEYLDLLDLVEREGLQDLLDLQVQYNCF